MAGSKRESGGGAPKGCRKRRGSKLENPSWSFTETQNSGCKSRGGRGGGGKGRFSQPNLEGRVEYRLIVAVRDEWLHGEIHLKLTRHWLHFISVPR